MAVAIVSETGMAIHIPFKAYIRGKISSNGIRNMTCRVKLRKMDLEAIPKDWNRLVVTIWNPTIDAHPVYGYIDEVRIGSEGPYNVIREKG